MRNNDSVEDSPFKEVGKGLAKISKNARKSSSPSSMSRQLTTISSKYPSTYHGRCETEHCTHVTPFNCVREIVSPFYR